MATPLLRLTEISKSYASIQALRGVNFELLPGEVHALVGENGAGKSTLIQVITGAQRPDAGTIEMDGRISPHLGPAAARQLGIACIYQHPALFPDLTVAENIALRLERNGALARVSWRSRRNRAQGLLKRIGADLSLEALVRDLSMPHQQLVEIACALGANARIVIMDEPTASLTQREQHLLYGLVRDLRDQGQGVVYVSHRLEEIFSLADRITILRDGCNIETAPASSLDEATLIRLMVGRELLSSDSNLPSGHGEEIAANRQAPLSVSPFVYDAGAKRPPPLLQVNQLCCAAAGIRNISFALQAGEVLGLAGLVGAGRTELAQTLFGVTRADSGEITLEGRRIHVRSPQEAVEAGIAYVPEDRTRQGVILDLPVGQNITMAIHRKLFPNTWLRPAAEREVANEWMRALDIKATNHEALARWLSGGNQQKVSVARWLAAKPKVLILDEPTQGVDVGAKRELHNLVRSLARQGLAILLISSDLPELLALSHRIGVMRNGRLVTTLPGRSDPHVVMAAAFGQEETLV